MMKALPRIKARMEEVRASLGDLRVEATSAGGLVAVKAFHLDLTPERAETLARALEAVVAGLPVHPASVTPVGAGLTDGVPYFAQSYVAAESLDVAIRNYAPASEEPAGLCLSQLAAALDLAHGQDLCHGALHQRDVFVSPELAQVTGLGVVPALERVGLHCLGEPSILDIGQTSNNDCEYQISATVAALLLKLQLLGWYLLEFHMIYQKLCFHFPHLKHKHARLNYLK